MDTKPLSVALVAAKKDGENVILRFSASNGHSYSLIFSPYVRRPIGAGFHQAAGN
jgi:hypothetical protein